ncbi:MAG: hypothetical protein RO469_17450 [Thermincola sp.]|nr:hypothetical protein [Thermincola sp.]
MEILLIVVPVIGALNAWLITTLFFKMLFWPQEPVKLPFGIVLRGLLPQKRDELAAGIGEIVETQLRVAVIGEQGLNPDIVERLTQTTASAAREHVCQRTPALIPKAVKLKVAELVENFIRAEMPSYALTLAEGMQKQDFSEDICSWAQCKINSYDLIKLEHTINSTKQVFYLKTGAAVIGFVLGLVQLAIVVVANLTSLL